MVFGSAALEWIVSIACLILLAGLWRSWQRMARLQADLAALRQRRGLFEDLLAAAPVALWARGPDGNVLYRNRLALDLIEAGESVEGERSEKIDRELCAHALAGNNKRTTDLTLVTEGQTRLYALTVLPRPGGAGTVHHASDMSAVEALQTDLAQHVAAQSEVLENLRTAIAIFGADRRLQFFNSAYADLWRLDKAWLADEPGLGDVLEAQRERRRLPEYADFPAFKREQLSLFQSLDRTREEMVHLPDGTSLRTLTSLHPMGGLMIAAEDVTDTLALERNYNTLIAVQRETLDNLAEGVALFGSDHRLKLHNAAFARLWELDAGWAENHPVIGQWFDRLRRFFASEAAWQAERRELFNNIDARRPHHLHLLRQDGRQLAVSFAPLPDGASFVSSQDITDREQAAQALAERNRALEAADRLKTEFVANMSYELRTPLNTIIGFADIMANGHTDGMSPRQMEYARGILESAQGLLDLIDDILDLARIDAGDLRLDVEEVDVHALLASALGLVREQARNQKLHILFDCSPAIGKAAVDVRRMRQILFHLLTNACKFTPPGGQVRLHALGDAERIVITVSDTGIGIPLDDRLRVFERFERGADFKRLVGNRLVGAGLGLSLVRSFVELHGGHIELQSVEGEGVSVICVLPRTAAPLVSSGAAR